MLLPPLLPLSLSVCTAKFLFYFIIYSIVLILKLFQIRLVRASLSWLLGFFDRTLSFEILSFFVAQDVLGASCKHPQSWDSRKVQLLLGADWSGTNYTDNHCCQLGNSLSPLFSPFLSLMSVFISISLYLSITNLQSPITIQHHRVHSAFPFFHICKSLFWQWETWHSLFSIYLLIFWVPLNVIDPLSPRATAASCLLLSGPVSSGQPPCLAVFLVLRGPGMFLFLVTLSVDEVLGLKTEHPANS